MANSFEQSYEIIMECNGWSWILENYYSFKVLIKCQMYVKKLDLRI